MDFDRLSWFTGGVLIGSLLDTKTTLALLACWTLVKNEPLPDFLGGTKPSEMINFIVGIFKYRIRKISTINTISTVPAVPIVPVVPVVSIVPVVPAVTTVGTENKEKDKIPVNSTTSLISASNTILNSILPLPINYGKSESPILLNKIPINVTKE